MKTIERHGFNLIEITLAIAIIAFGMSSILVLFPTGVNTVNEGVADSVVPDTADYVLNYMQAMVDIGWRDEDGKARDENPVLKALKDEKPDTEAADPGKNLEFETPDTVNQEDFSSKEREKAGCLFAAKGSSNKGIYLYEQAYYLPQDGKDDGSTDAEDVKVVDFSAIVLVWREKDTFLYHENDVPRKMDAKQAVTLCVEVSWPASRPYADREKQTWRLELYNQAGKTE